MKHELLERERERERGDLDIYHTIRLRASPTVLIVLCDPAQQYKLDEEKLQTCQLLG